MKKYIGIFINKNTKTRQNKGSLIQISGPLFCLLYRENFKESQRLSARGRNIGK